MDRIREDLYRDYKRWSKKLGRPFPSYLSNTVSMDTILRAHYLLCDYFIREGEDIALAGPRDSHLLPSAVGRQFVEFGGVRKWKTDLEVCATLFYGLVMDHPFHDGNKRTAFLVGVYHLFKGNRIVSTKHKPWEDLAVHTAGNTLATYPQYKSLRRRNDAEVRFIADFFRRNTRRIDKRDYIVTFNQLRAILQRFGFDLDDPSGNFIHVIRETEMIRGSIFRKRKEIERQKILKIGFPGWTKEVSRKDLRRIRKETALDSKHEIDSQVFFKGEEPLEALIPRYHGVLLRLKDK